MVGLHHQLNGHEFDKAPGDSAGQGRSGMLQTMGSQRAERDLTTEKQQQRHTQKSVKKKSIEIVFEWGHILDLADKDFRVTITKYAQRTNENYV